MRGAGPIGNAHRWHYQNATLRRVFLLLLVILANISSALQDGLALSPPMGWRSWNLYGTNVNQDLLLKIMKGMIKKRGKEQLSLCDLGYCQVGLDDNWQRVLQVGPKQCTYHNDSGYPLVNTERFPNMKSMTTYAHDLGLTVGWYFNNCYECHEQCPADPKNYTPTAQRPETWNSRIYFGERLQGTANERCYDGDVQALVDYGFDGVKLDACGWQMDLDLWQQLIQQKQTKPILIEACHWGKTVPEKPIYQLDQSNNNNNNNSNNTVDTGWCPFHYWRTSGDIWASFGSILAILQYTFQFEGLSRPGCWAHLDMLEVGCAKGPNGQQDEGLSLAETRTHFAAWAIMSSPLFLSHDVTNESIMDQVWPIISNREIIAINQAWAGFSGGPYWKSQEKLQFLFTDVPLFRPWVHKGLYLYKPLDRIDDYDDDAREDRYTRVAILLINSDTNATDFEVNLLDIPGLDCVSRNDEASNSSFTNNVHCEVRNVWKQESRGIMVEDERFSVPNVESHDCAFFIIETPRPHEDNGWTSFFAVTSFRNVASSSGRFSLLVVLLLGFVIAGQRIGLAAKKRGKKESKLVRV